jgi:hypothetical protein
MATHNNNWPPCFRRQPQTQNVVDLLEVGVTWFLCKTQHNVVSLGLWKLDITKNVLLVLENQTKCLFTIYNYLFLLGILGSNGVWVNSLSVEFYSW